jgi:D-alanyl-D-alanine carboxypeptidase
LDDQRPIAKDDRFRIGSITKTFVAVLVLQLIADGLLRFTDTIDALLPGVVPGGGEISVDQLLRMRSGLPDYTPHIIGTPPDFAQLQTRYWSPESLVAAALQSTDRLAPGGPFRYCNTDYIILGLIVERATGQRVDAQLWQRVLAPAALINTTFPTVDPQLPNPHADGYLRLASDQPYTEFNVVTPSEGWTAGGIISTPADLARFFDALFDGELLDQDSLGLMIACEEKVHDTRWRGLGLDLRIIGGDTRVYGHHGGVPGFTSMVVRTKAGRNVVLYQNGIDMEDCMAFDVPFIVAAVTA